MNTLAHKEMTIMTSADYHFIPKDVFLKSFAKILGDDYTHIIKERRRKDEGDYYLVATIEIGPHIVTYYSEGYSSPCTFRELDKYR